MANSKQNRRPSNPFDEDSTCSEAPVPVWMSAFDTSSDKVFRNSGRVNAFAALSTQSHPHELNFNAVPSPWLLESQAQVISLRSLSFNVKTGWIVIADANHSPGSNDIQLCWLPIEMRGTAFSSHQSMFVIASRFNYQLTIIDFKLMLAMLRNFGVISENDCL
jgi:hypothetical protein